MSAEAPVAANAPIDPEKPSIVKQGIIAIILRPSDTQTGAYEYYLLDHNHYSQNEDGTPKTVHAGIGLLSETMQEGEDSEDYLSVMARGYVEEIMGVKLSEKPDGAELDSFARLVGQARAGMEENLREIGTFNHDFNYHDRDKYFSDPNTRGFVHVFVDDTRRMDVGDINQEEVDFAGHLGSMDLNHPYIRYRTGYDTKFLLESPELEDILRANDITIGE